MRRILGFLVVLSGLLISGTILYRAGPVTDPAAALAVADADPDGEDVAEPPPPLDAPKSPLTDAEREARRFARYDKDNSGAINRAEYLVNRRKAFGKADLNGDGRLDFEEFAAATTKKFARADRDANGLLSEKEFATTAIRRKPKAACVCPPPNKE